MLSMEKINTETYYSVFKFKLITMFTQIPSNTNLLEKNLKSINFEYHPKKWFWNKNKEEMTLDLVYYMSDNFNLTKKNKKDLINQELKIIGISNDESKIILHYLKIKEVLFLGLNPTQLDYAETGRMCYSLKIKCKEF